VCTDRVGCINIAIIEGACFYSYYMI
jgi:hypothetical protein